MAGSRTHAHATVTFDPAKVLSVLNEHDVRYVLIGGLAARYQGADLLTEDVDVTPDRDEVNLERLADALAALDAQMLDPAGNAIDLREPRIEPELMTRMRSFRTQTRYGVLDVSLRPDGTDGYSDLVRRAEYIVVDSVAAPVANLRDVIRSKEAAGRAKDLAVLPQLNERVRRLETEGPQQAPIPVDPERYEGG